MSRVHITFEIKKEDSSEISYEVISPDFSEKGTEREMIGLLTLDLNEKVFSYDPIERLRSEFCPPEYFEKYSGDLEKVDEVCKNEALMCTAWSYRIYKKAEKELSSR